MKEKLKIFFQKLKTTLKNIVLLFVVLLGLLVIVNIVPMACTQEDDTIRILKQNGYSNIVITGWRPFMASKGESFSTGFEAVSPNGSKVSGVVTSGWFKGKTIRLD